MPNKANSCARVYLPCWRMGPHRRRTNQGRHPNKLSALSVKCKMSELMHVVYESFANCRLKGKGLHKMETTLPPVSVTVSLIRVGTYSR